MKEKIDIQRITNPAWQRPAIITLWSYAPTGLLTNKVYADGKGTAYTYTPDGKLASRLWARGVTTSYTYTNGSSLVAIDYSDNTPDVAFTYDRLGRQVSAIVDGVSTNTYTYDSETLALSVETQNGLEINRTTDALGLDIGFSLGSVYGVQYGYDTYGRFSSLRALAPLRETNTFTYSYLPNTDLLSGMSASSGFLWTRAYESGRSLITSVENSFGETVISRYNYTNDELGRRTSRADSGLAFAAQPTYGDPATVEMPAYNAYSYNTRAEVTGATRRWGTPGASGDLVLGQQYAYEFDSIGNRITSAKGDNSRTATYTANALNQYTQRTVPAEKDLIGTAPTNVAVTINATAVTRQNVYWHHALEVDNATDAAYPQVAITAVYNPPGTNTPDMVASQTGRVFVAETPESFQYDSDGNLTQDGRFDYTWNGENRLIKAETRDDIPAAVPRVTVEYAYDHQGRMAWKQISTNAVIVSTRTLLWDGYNIIQARTHSQTHTLTNSFLWGLDLSGTLQGAGGVGGLLAEVQDGEPYFAAFDANGNVTEYLTADGTLAAHREYSPCGETIAMTGTEPDAFLHWFSTKPWCAVTGLSEYEFRKYSPSMERWLSRDPLGDHASPGARILHGEIAARMAFAAIVNLHIALDEELDDHDRIIAILNTLYWFKGIQTLRSGDPSIGFGWFDPLTGRWFSNDPMGISGGLNQYVACGNSLVTFVDPLGLRLWQAQYWADRSIRGIWINRAFSTVMGVLASAVPDVITLDGRVAGALLGGGEFGGGAIINLNDGSVSGYDTRGPGVGRQGLAPSLTLGVGWNSDVTAPKNISFEGPFHEFSVSWSRSAVGETASYYIGGGWQGINYGITRPGFGYMYTLVEYDVWEGDAPPQSPYGDGACK